MAITLVSALTAPIIPAQQPLIAVPPPVTIAVVATAYSPRAQETDSTPFITAAGTKTRDGVIAANFLPFGTTVRFPDRFGEKIFVVEDRMNRRYTNAYPHRVDIVFENTAHAIRFGRQSLNLEIITMGSVAQAKTAADISLRSPLYPAS